ncbi:hypothetical protein [Crocinitomix algicola]|uniref:hypothetical protein n=1 Tax=Crocinitomix algicola TaxID=1740263 RepID=UPI000833FC52|nr:hypothetical protein [Crocinitomix algicola]
MRFLTLLLSIPLFNFAQTLNFNPNVQVNKTIAQDYYDTDFIYIENNSSKSLSLDFEVLDNDLLNEWSTSACTNFQCFNLIPKVGSFGNLDPGSQGFLSLNLSANETLGTGSILFLITSPDDASISDTLRFEYTVTETGKLEAKPWAKINHINGVLTVFLDNPFANATLLITQLNGQIVYQNDLEPITSIALRDYAAGFYLIAIQDEQGRTLKETVFQP